MSFFAKNLSLCQSLFMFQKDYSFCINSMYWILTETTSGGLSKFDKLNCFKLLDALRTSKFIIFCVSFEKKFYIMS